MSTTESQYLENKEYLLYLLRNTTDQQDERSEHLNYEIFPLFHFCDLKYQMSTGESQYLENKENIL